MLAQMKALSAGPGQPRWLTRVLGWLAFLFPVLYGVAGISVLAALVWLVLWAIHKGGLLK
jgi:hypothetical protein